MNGQASPPSSLLPTSYLSDAHCKVSTHFSLHSPPYSLLNGRTLRKVGRREKGEEGSAWMARVGAPRTAEAARPLCKSLSVLCKARHLPCPTDAHCIVSTHFSLHSPPYSLLDGRPLQSVHALFPPFSSLFSTFLYSDCVEDCEECDPHVGEDSFPEGCLSEA